MRLRNKKLLYEQKSDTRSEGYTRSENISVMTMSILLLLAEFFKFISYLCKLKA